MGIKTCHNDQRIAKTFDDLATCKGDCEADGDCVRIFWQSAEQRGKSEPKCHRYRACAQLRTPPKAGTNYEYSCYTLGPDHEDLDTALQTTGCTSGYYTGDAPTDTSAWETMLETQTRQEVFEDLYDTCYHAKRGTATPTQEHQCCGEAAVDVHMSSLLNSGGVTIHTCGPKASTIPFTGIAVASNPPECKQMFNFPCEQFTYRERVARAVRATGCPTREYDWDLIDSWESFTDIKIWGRIQDYCEVVQKSIGSASTIQKGKDFCCGEGVDCMPEHCTTQTSWDCGEPSCPIMEDTGFSGASGIWTHIEASEHNCQSMCNVHTECMSWSWNGVICQLFSDTISTSTAVYAPGMKSGYKCAKTYNCVQGQGKQGSAYAMYSYNTEAECAAKCFEDSGKGKLGTSIKKAYTCVNGQGPSGGTKQSTSNNNRDTCANICNSDSSCVGFDWTTHSRSDSCRTYHSTSGARVDNAGSHDRQWCKQVTQPCVGFDFTETEMTNACRLYSSTSGARVGNEGNDKRKWCPEHTGGFLPEAEFECEAASLDGVIVYSEDKGDETAEECARKCASDPGCAGFDLHFVATSTNPCRLLRYAEDNGDLGSSGGNSRRFCRRLTFSERSNAFCDGMSEDICDETDECRWRDETNECTMEDTIWCRNGRISDTQRSTSKWNKYYEKYTFGTARECWDKCYASPQCFAYEYKQESGNHGDGKTVGTCYLYDALTVVDTWDRYVYDPGCPEGPNSSAFGCSDELWSDNGWKYCRRFRTNDIDWYYSSSQQYWAPARP